MMRATKKFQCGHCDRFHDDEGDAEECCRPEVYIAWVCKKCNQPHESEEQAEDCCMDELSEAEIELLSRPTTQELEAAGQQRLFR